MSEFFRNNQTVIQFVILGVEILLWLAASSFFVYLYWKEKNGKSSFPYTGTGSGKEKDSHTTPSTKTQADVSASTPQKGSPPTSTTPPQNNKPGGQLVVGAAASQAPLKNPSGVSTGGTHPAANGTQQTQLKPSQQQQTVVRPQPMTPQPPAPAAKTLSQQNFDSIMKVLSEIINGNAPTILKEISSGIDDIKKDLNVLKTKEGCCFKEKLLKDGIPAVFLNSVGEVYKNCLDLNQVITGVASDQADSLSFTEMFKAIEDLKEEKALFEGDNKRLNGELQQKDKTIREKNQIITNQEGIISTQKTKIETQETTIKEKDQSINTIKNDLAAEYASKEQTLKTNHQREMQSSLEKFEKIAPREILSLFNISFENFEMFPKKLMAAYSYMCLLKDLHSFERQFQGFDDVLYSAFDGNELKEVRSKVQAHLNQVPGVQGVFKIQWATPGQIFNSKYHLSDSKVGQVIKTVKTATVFRIENGNGQNPDGAVFNCIIRGQVDTE